MAQQLPPVDTVDYVPGAAATDLQPVMDVMANHMLSKLLIKESMQEPSRSLRASSSRSCRSLTSSRRCRRSKGCWSNGWARSNDALKQGPKSCTTRVEELVSCEHATVMARMYNADRKKVRRDINGIRFCRDNDGTGAGASLAMQLCANALLALLAVQ